MALVEMVSGTVSDEIEAAGAHRGASIEGEDAN